MPRFSLNTNVPVLQIPDDFLKTSTALMSKTLGKNIAYCVSTVNPSLKMTLGGSNEPCGLVEVTSLGGIGIEENKKCIEVLTDHIQQNIGIPKDKKCVYLLKIFPSIPLSSIGLIIFARSIYYPMRLFMRFQPNIIDNVAYLGTTFHHLCIAEKRKRLN